MKKGIKKLMIIVLFVLTSSFSTASSRVNRIIDQIRKDYAEANVEQN